MRPSRLRVSRFEPRLAPMIDAATASVFETLTAKQRQAMALAADGLTSKEIARELDISPHSVDKRIDAVRGRLDARPRSQIVRDYRAWSDRTGEPITGDRSPLTHPSPDTASLEPQPEGETLPFDDGSHLRAVFRMGSPDRMAAPGCQTFRSGCWRTFTVRRGRSVPGGGGFRAGRCFGQCSDRSAQLGWPAPRRFNRLWETQHAR